MNDLLSHVRHPSTQLHSRWRWISCCALCLAFHLSPHTMHADIIFSSSHAPPIHSSNGFINLTPDESGLTFTNQLDTLAGLNNSILNNGSGVSIGDLNGDLRPDIFLTGLTSDNKLFLNRGDFHFQESPIGDFLSAHGRYCFGSLLIDFDQDGHLDILFASWKWGLTLARNNGLGQFTQVTGSGLDGPGTPMSLASADFDLDGDLDIYATFYLTDSIVDQPDTQFSLQRKSDGQWNIARINRQPPSQEQLKNYSVTPEGTLREYGENDRLYINRGNGTFDLHQPDGENPRFTDIHGKPFRAADWGLSCRFQDLNGDQWPDIYVCNDSHSPDRLWINQRNGTFKLMSHPLLPRTSLSSMGADCADVNRDGLLDILVLDMLAFTYQDRIRQLEIPDISLLLESPAQVPHNTLLIQHANGTYSELALSANVAATDWSWTALFLDVDLDGWDDLLVSNGFHRDVRDSDSLLLERQLPHSQKSAFRSRFPAWLSPNRAFRNDGNLRFSPNENWNFSLSGITHGMALGDLDGDGDMDVVANNLNSPAMIFKNISSRPRVSFHPESQRDRSALDGATFIYHDSPTSLPQTKSLTTGGHYLSSSGPTIPFAHTQPESTGRITIHYRDGTSESHQGILPNSHYLVRVSPSPHPAPHAAAPAEKPGYHLQKMSGVRLNHQTDPAPVSTAAMKHFLNHAPGWTGIQAVDLQQDGISEILTFAPDGSGFIALFQQPDATWKPSKLPIPQPLAHPSIPVTYLEFRRADPVTKYLFIGQSFPASTSDWNGATIHPTLYSFQFGRLSLSTIPHLPATDWMTAFHWDDWDNDGDDDLITAGKDPDNRLKIQIYENSSGMLQLSDSVSLDSSFPISAVTHLATAQIDDSPQKEILFAISPGPIGYLSLNPLTKTWSRNGDSSPLLPSANHTSIWSSLTAIDFKNDSKPEVLAASHLTNTYLQLAQTQGLSPALIAADYNKSGSMQIIPTAKDSKGHFWPLIGREELTTIHPLFQIWYPTSQALVDTPISQSPWFQASSNSQIVLSQLDPILFAPNHPESPIVRTLPAFLNESPIVSTTQGDFNNDSSPDLAVAVSGAILPSHLQSPSNSHHIYFLSQDPQGSISLIQEFLIPFPIATIHSATLNHDPFTDLIILNKSGEIWTLTSQPTSPQ